MNACLSLGFFYFIIKFKNNNNNLNEIEKEEKSKYIYGFMVSEVFDFQMEKKGKGRKKDATSCHELDPTRHWFEFNFYFDFAIHDEIQLKRRPYERKTRTI